MKPLIVATTIALGLACTAGVSAAQDASRSASLQHVTVSASLGPFETYAVNVNADYGLRVLVGDTHQQYMQARRTAESSEALRAQGKALSPFVEVALDNSSGPGMGRQIVLSDPIRNTVAVMDVFCKGYVAPGSKHCRLVSRPAPGQSLASRAAGSLQLAVVDVH